MASIFEENKTCPKVFISYSYDSQLHEKWVEELMNNLRSNAGVNAIIDKCALSNSNDLDEIMISGFRDSDKVIIILTREYAKKADSDQGGVSFETKLASIISRDPNQKSKLIFVKKDEVVKFNEVFPFQFKDYYAIDMSFSNNFDAKFEELYHKIWNQPYLKIAPIGNNPFESQSTGDFEINSEVIYNILENNDFEPYNIIKEDLNSNSIIIWPVVPRTNLTIIHYSQIEVIRILSLLGINSIIIIANCGQSEIVPNKTDIDFKEKLETYIKKKGVSSYKINFLNSYFSSDFSDGSIILSNFVKISSALKISQLYKFNTKDNSYDSIAKSEIRDRTTLKYISPLFTWSASIYEATKYFETTNDSKAIIIAGRDEESQWSHVISEINSHIGAVFIPILKQEDDKTLYQEKKLSVFSKQQIERELGKGNIDKWLFQSFISLAEFPKNNYPLSFCKKDKNICGDIEESNRCISCLFPDDSVSLKADVDKKKFVEMIYENIQ